MVSCVSRRRPADASAFSPASAIPSWPAPSWGWLHSALRSIRRLESTLRTSPPELPLLTLVSRQDPVVDLAALRRHLDALPAADLRILRGTGHELLREVDALRLPVLARIDHFLDRLALRSG